MTLAKADVRERIGLKETVDPVPLCHCFGFTKAMIVDEVRATGRCTIHRRIAVEEKAGTCACQIRTPQGSCCLGNVTASVKEAMKPNAGPSKRTLWSILDSKAAAIQSPRFHRAKDATVATPHRH